MFVSELVHEIVLLLQNVKGSDVLDADEALERLELFLQVIILVFDADHRIKLNYVFVELEDSLDLAYLRAVVGIRLKRLICAPMHALFEEHIVIIGIFESFFQT